MIYIRNCSNRVIHLADVMLLPDEKVKDVNPRTGEPYSDIPLIKRFMEMGMLELVDVRPATKAEAFKPTIKVEIEEASEEENEEPVKAPEAPAAKIVEEEEEAEAEEPAPEAPVEKKTTQSRGRKKKS